MRPNTLLTTLLYVLLFGLIIVAVWKGCEMQRNQELQKRDAEALKRTMTDNAFVDSDSSEYGSSFSAEEETPLIIRPGESSPNVSGIEDEDVAPPASAQTQQRPAATAAAPPKSTAAKTPVSQAPAVVAAREADNSANPPAVKRDARYHVVAGSFTKMEGARRQLEQVIKLGFTNAEIGKYNSGKFAVVIVRRTDDLQEARSIEAKLEAKGIDARVFEPK